MAEIDTNLLFEIFSRIQADVSETKSRLDRIGQRMEHLEWRQTASMHFEQSVLAHLTGINESMDDVRAQFIGIDRRVTTLEAR